MAITATLTNTLTTAETVSGLKVTTSSVTHSDSQSHTLSAATTPPATKHVAKTVALSAGAATIDLTALTAWGTNGVTEDTSGLKLQILRAKATASNANPIAIKTGASNGYAAWGASWLVELKAGQEVTLYGNDATPDVAGAAKTIDLSGTGTQSVDIEMVFG
ncbi:MAG: hypothetical protein KJ050_10660 [Candidatus Omnitrophica bacterium]|nr:hypothetical protein [Candidatus Omnitrophota bacterium]